LYGQKSIKNRGEIIIYQDKPGETAVDVRLEEDTIWANLNQITQIFDRDKSVISRHISNILKEKELDKNSVVAKIATTAMDQKVYQVDFYNLDMIISIGYRVNSKKATQFRIWATNILKKYLTQASDRFRAVFYFRNKTENLTLTECG